MKKYVVTAALAAALPFSASAQSPADIKNALAGNSLWESIQAEGSAMKEVRVSELANDLQCARRAVNAARPNGTTTRLFITTRKGETSLLMASGNGKDSAVMIMELKQDGKFEYTVRKNGDEAKEAGTMSADALIHKAPFGHSLASNFHASDVMRGSIFAIRNCETGTIFPQPLAYSDPAYTSTHTRQSFGQQLGLTK